MLRKAREFADGEFGEDRGLGVEVEIDGAGDVAGLRRYGADGQALRPIAAEHAASGGQNLGALVRVGGFAALFAAAFGRNLCVRQGASPRMKNDESLSSYFHRSCLNGVQHTRSDKTGATQLVR